MEQCRLLDERNETSFINGIKSILCFMVLISHFYNYIGGKQVLGIPLVGAFGARAVDVFFFLSGFLTVFAYIKRNKHFEKKKFIVKRWFRLYPVYLVCLICAFFSTQFLTKVQSNTLIFFNGNTVGAYGYQYLPQENLPSMMDFISHLLLIHGTIMKPYGSSILAPAWSLSVEWLFYIGAAIAFMLYFSVEKLMSDKGSRFLHSIYFGSLVLGGVEFLYHRTDDMQGFLRNLPVFLLGVIIAQYYYRKQLNWKNVIVISVGVIYLFLLCPNQNWTSAGTIVLVSILLFCNYSFFRLKLIAKILSSKVMTMLCDLSYSIYLVHMLILPVAFIIAIKIGMMCFLSKQTILAIAAILFIVFVVVVAFFLNRCIEKPAMRIYKKIFTS